MWNWLGGGAPTSQETTQEGDTQNKEGPSDGVTEATSTTPAGNFLWYLRIEKNFGHVYDARYILLKIYHDITYIHI